MKSSFVSSALVAALALAPSLASAQDAAASEESAAIEEARAHFQVAMEHYEAGRFREAADEFQRSYDLSHRPELLHNIYLSRRDVGDIRGAVEALRLYLTEATIPEADRTTLVHRLHGMESSLGQAPSAPPEPPPAEADAPPPDPALLAPENPPADPPVDPPPPATGGNGDLATAGWILAASAVVPAVVAAIGGAMMLSEHDTLYAACTAGPTRDQCPASVDTDAAVSRFQTDRALLWTGVGVGAAMLVTGVVMGIAGAPPDDAPHASVACTPDGCTATTTVRF